LKLLKSTVKRCVLINGKRYGSLSEAARTYDIPLYKIHRAANARIKIEGLEIMYELNIQGIKEEPERERGSTPLLFYPVEDDPLRGGLPKQWK